MDDAAVYSPWQDLDLLSFMWKKSAIYKGTLFYYRYLFFHNL